MTCPTCGRKPEEVVSHRTLIGPPTSRVVEFRCRDAFHDQRPSTPELDDDKERDGR